MPAEIRTPFIKSRALMTAPSVWRKKVLPVGEVEYQGRMLQFDRDYLEDLAAAFKAGAYDQVPFQLATDDNKHTNNPERTRGWVTGVEVQNDGLWVTARVTPEGNKVLTSNPNLGVSARIVEEYARSDGNFFPAAIQHVLGTLDPRIPGLGPWEAVEMSNSAGVDMIIDLSAAEFAGEEGGSTMPDMDADQQARLARLLELDPDEIAGLLDQLNEDASDDTEDETMDEDELIAAINSMTDDEFAQVAAEFDVAEPAPQSRARPCPTTTGCPRSSWPTTAWLRPSGRCPSSSASTTSRHSRTRSAACSTSGSLCTSPSWRGLSWRAPAGRWSCPTGRPPTPA